MTNFITAHTFTAHWEGGLSDHPKDPGGITQFGVSLRWLKTLPLHAADVDADGDIDADDIRSLTSAQAAALFCTRFWEPYRLGDFAPPVAVTLYDTVVNCGPAQAIRLIQRASNDLLPSTSSAGTSVKVQPLVPDGKLGPLTRAALHAHSPLLLAERLLDRRQSFYQQLVLEQPGQYGDFLRGWFRRCDALRAHIRTLARQAACETTGEYGPDHQNGQEQGQKKNQKGEPAGGQS